MQSATIVLFHSLTPSITLTKCIIKLHYGLRPQEPYTYTAQPIIITKASVHLPQNKMNNWINFLFNVVFIYEQNNFLFVDPVMVHTNTNTSPRKYTHAHMELFHYVL